MLSKTQKIIAIVLLGIWLSLVVTFFIFKDVKQKPNYDYLGYSDITLDSENKKGTDNEDNNQKIKMDIITSKIEDIPPEINKTKSEIIDDYLWRCHQLQTTKEKIDCIDVYYGNKNYQEIKSQCNSLVGKDQKRCMEEYYYFQAQSSLDETYCMGIKDEALRQECLGYN